ncbi:MAG: 4-hydroxythreonine-4-phosphate dehydrogenase [Candidatus Kapaibacterium sp.]|nr:MAG: 4-hydroxythreonine-4-phosphate dehydrogenase [Candidatus Kapabacteria bacterium]
MKRKINVGITIGDINGIGLEIFAKFINSQYFEKIESKVKFTLFGNENAVFEYFKSLENSGQLEKRLENALQSGSLHLVNINVKPKIEFGKIQELSGKLAIESISTSLDAFLQKKIDCLVTLPISKKAIQMTKPNFIGHTEYIADYLNAKDPLMTFVYQNFRLCLLTTHIPISKVSGEITSETIIKKAKIFAKSLMNDFNVVHPKIAILGLNPHSGENGAIGKEEIEIFHPSIAKLRDEIQIAGPFPSDGFFAFGTHKNFDGTIACYHDQGLIAFKILSKGEGVNFTANLPLVRTSPDHGTGFDIAGKNIASFKSLKNAIMLAVKITKARPKMTK